MAPLPPAPRVKGDRLAGVANNPIKGSAENVSDASISPVVNTDVVSKSMRAKATSASGAAATSKRTQASSGVTETKSLVSPSHPLASPNASTPTANSSPKWVSMPPSPAKAGAGPSARRSKRSLSAPKLFVLDTNVLMHDPMCLFQFHEHDVFLPMVVLEELDNHKKGMTEVARNARQTSRSLDSLAGAVGANIDAGLSLDSIGHKGASGKLFFQTQAMDVSVPSSLPRGKADNQILGVVNALRQTHAPRPVVLVSKDINMRIKARALGLEAEDYQNDKTLEDGDLLYSGVLALPPDFWQKAGKKTESWQEGIHTFYRVTSPAVTQMMINQFVYYEAPGETPLLAKVVELEGNSSAILKSLKDFRHAKHAAWGITARNREQIFAMNLLTDPAVDLVTLTGTAGSGKTLLALACGLTQVLDERKYTEILVTRATVSVGEDIGFLPGTEEEKMNPWMGALDDNLEVLTKSDGAAGEWGKAATNELLRSRVKVKSMNFMRGRTFLNKFVIVDEAQNLTPKQIKTLVTRAGPGTKMVLLGNLAQIDTPYLTEGSSGLTYAVDRFKGWPHSGHITLARGERSRLADFASEVL